MNIEITLYPPLRKKLFSRVPVSLVSPATVNTLLQHLAIEQHQIGSVYVNGNDTTFHQPLVTGDRVSLLPLIGGG